MNSWNLESYEAFFIDVDGVLVHDTQPIPGAAEAFKLLQERGDVFILTNNSTRSRAQHAAHLTNLGFSVQPDRVICSSYLIAEYLRRAVGRTTVWPIGEEGMTSELLECGHEIASEPHLAQWIVTGMDRDLTYQKIAHGLHALVAGAQWAASNIDGTYPTPKGLMPGAGAIVGALRGMGFVPTAIVGKPESPAFEMGRDLARTDKILMIGDRLETDILGGNRNGIDTLFVLSGISAEADMQSENIYPTWIAKSIASLLTADVARPMRVSS